MAAINTVRRRILETPLSTYVTEFIVAKKSENRSAKTLDWYGWLLGKFCEATNDPSLSDFSLKLVRNFVVQLQERDTRYVNHPISHAKEGGLVGARQPYRRRWAGLPRPYVCARRLYPASV